MISKGQRYISTSEPSLGLGHLISSENGLIEIHFPASQTTRTYSAENAPLLRVRFSPGDEISDQSHNKFIITSITENDHLLTYHCGTTSIHESQLLDSLSFIKPEKRLLAGITDDPRDFDLRLEALRWNSNIRRSPAQGFTGARIDLIPHQLSIVAEAANRLHPRLILADEVGLGKTIEACLILHRLHLTGRANRILIIVPEPLIHQWFIELLRRFNLLFAIFDEERCLSITDSNPFADSQLILTSTSFLSENPHRANQAQQANFDLLIVDEAHHLEWSETHTSPAYQTVESLAAIIPSVLLLTATPQKLGPEGHFARLRLLDPARYHHLKAFLTETESYAPLATAIDSLLQNKISKNISHFTLSPESQTILNQLQSGHQTDLQPLISELIDSFGTGRILFRNTRKNLTGFPKRIPILHPLREGSCPYQWLTKLIKSLPPSEKILLITSSPQAAINVQEKLLNIIQITTALFHEDLSLLQRDRNAAYFQESDGAQILICSEIGSEGRNFQFAKHLVLFGLPRDPEILEQRIGRLDRIGQTGDIHIHIPFGKNSKSELHALWLHQGLDAFSAPLKGATTLATTLLPELDQLAETKASSKPFKDFILRSKKLKNEVSQILNTGHDRLLELGAPPPSLSTELIQTIQSADENPRFEQFTIRLLDHLGLEIADLSARSYILKHGNRLSEAFADIGDDGLSITFDRSTALSREDLSFLTIDHPILRDALHQILDSNSGNASFATLSNTKTKSILLDCAFILETIAPPHLHLDRFLPPTLLRVIVDHTGKSLTKPPPSRLLQPADPRRIVSQESFKSNIFPKMLDTASKIATRATTPTQTAIDLATTTLTAQINRLKNLSTRNPNISQAEIQSLQSTLRETLHHLSTPRLRLDSLRLIYTS